VSSSVSSESADAAAGLVGAWQLLGWLIHYEDGRRARPFGEDPIGLLVYSAEGWMNVCVCSNDRVPLAGRDARRAPYEQQAAAFASYFSYAGRYEVAGGIVTHHVTVALDPAFVGTRQARRIARHGDDLELTADEAGPGGARRHLLSWRRAQPAGGAGANSGSVHQG
jgi:hypothetical protein